MSIVEQFRLLRASEEIQSLGEPGVWLQLDRMKNEEAVRR